MLTDNHAQRSATSALPLAPISTTQGLVAGPKNAPALAGIFTMRSRVDADNFKKHMPAGGHVVTARRSERVYRTTRPG